jgi:thiol-disulfide isomerase/thioredoxin
MRLSPVLGVLLCVLLALAACGPAPAAAPAEEEAAPDTERVSEEPSEDSEETATEKSAVENHAEDETAEGEMASEEEMASDEIAPEEAVEEPAIDRPAWQQIALTDSRTGETFTLADFAGKTVFVETMATWCTNCRQQLKNVKEVAAQVDSEDVVFIAISVETNISAEQLAQYQQNEGFDWSFAVATPELLQALVDEFGQTITNPPSTPHFILYSDGTSTDLTTGIESADEILTQLNAAQG